LPQPPDAPITRTLEIDGEATALTGPCLGLVVRGEPHARDESGECVGLAAGDLLTVVDGARCRLGGPREAAELRLFAAPPAWVREALDLAGATARAGAVAFHVDRCGSETARRAARLLREPALPGRDEALAALLETSRHLELLAIASTPRERVLEPNRRREGARARRRRLRFLEIVEALSDEPLDGISLTDLAGRLGTSERQVSRLFRSELGTTFREHVATLRIERAKRLLRETDLPVIEVAAETGWGSLGHFTTTFRRRIGQTPSGYRASAPAPSDRAA